MVPAAKNEAKLNFPVTDEPQMGECYNYLATKKAIGFAKAFAKFYIKSPEAMEGFEKTEEPFEISVGNDTMIISEKYMKITKRRPSVNLKKQRIS